MTSPHEESNERTITAIDILEQERQLEAEAGEIYTYKVDNCSYDLGYIAQPVYACLTCTPIDAGGLPAGICYSCQIMCHSNHEVIELFGKRHFRCDCGSDTMCRDPNLGNDCKLRMKKNVINHENIYNHNFRKRCCTCDQPYDPDQESGVMYQCLNCQDWFHDRCIETDVKIPDTESFSEMICKSCSANFPILMSLQTIGVREEGETGEEFVEICDSQSKSPISAETSIPRFFKEPHHKRLRLCVCLSSCPETNENDYKAVYIFLPNEWRRQICKCNKCMELIDHEKLSYFIEEETLYTPEPDADAGKSLFESGVDMLQKVDRVKAIEGIHAMNNLSAKMKEYFRKFAESGTVVTEADIREFFEAVQTRKH